MFTDFRSGALTRRQVKLLENYAYRGKGGDVVYRQIKLNVSVILITIRATCHWMGCNLKERGAGE